MSKLIYRLLVSTLVPLIFIILWVRSFKDPRYRQRLAERLGRVSPALQQRAEGGLVVHCASVGEVEAAKPLIEALLRSYPNTPVLVTCTTPTGSERITSLFGERVAHCYLPLDTSGAVDRWLKALQPRALLLLETELWPNLLIACRHTNTQTFLVNARLSRQSARAYRRFHWFSALIFAHLDGVFAQNKASLRRFKKLGFNNQAWLVGNLKFDLLLTKKNLELPFQHALEQRQVFVAGSTHAGEDEQLIHSFVQLSQQHPALLLVLVPRHPERFAPVAQRLEEAGLVFQRLSQIKHQAEHQAIDASTQVVLGDTMGDLMRWYHAANWVFIGGSLINRGGHNPLEAMVFAKPIISGRHVFNFADIYRQLDQQQALAWVDSAEDITCQLNDFIARPHQAQRAGLRAQTIFNQHKGACARLLSQLEQQLGDDLNHQRLTHQNNSQTLIDSRFIADDLIEQAFNSSYWKTENKVIGSSVGRNQAWFIAHQNQKMVLRHYYRGGLIGKLIKDRFLHQAASHSRAFQEFKLLTWMRTQGLPVPRACGARYQSSGLFYRADILVELIPDSQDLYRFLCHQPLNTEIWARIGSMIAQFHRTGVFHSDLNCHNILLDKHNQAWLIDFDKCERRLKGKWPAANLARLKRSLDKEKDQNNLFHFDTADWQAFMKGYNSESKSTI